MSVIEGGLTPDRTILINGPAGLPRVVPVTQGLFSGLGRGCVLLGSRCRGCDTVYFPSSPNCRNPGCGQRAVEPATLPRTGILYSHTLQAYRPPPPFRMDPWAPFQIGLVDLDGGPRVLGLLDLPVDASPRIGMALEVITRRLHADEQGRDVVTYAFGPVSPADSPS